MFSNSDLIETIATAHAEKLTRKDVRALLDSLATVGHYELKKNGVESRLRQRSLNGTQV